MQTASTLNSHFGALVGQDFLVTDTTVCAHASKTVDFMAIAHTFPITNVSVILVGMELTATKTVVATTTALATAENVTIARIIQQENSVSCVR